MITGRMKAGARRLLRPAAQLIADLGIPPTTLTLAGLALSVLAGWSLGIGHLPRAGILLALAGLCDMMDGAAARAGNRASRVGAFLDSTTDRYAEVLVFLGALHFYLVRSPRGAEAGTATVILLALAGSLLVSYVRARAEAIGIDCEVGLLERPERLIILIVGLLLGPSAFRVLLWVLMVLSHFTAFQRIRHVLSGIRE